MLVLVADLHLRENTPAEQDFRAFLRRLSAGTDDVCFLGDIMELWIALPAFENDLQRDFLAWCRQELPRRKIYLLEGNHEFFVVRHHRDCFSAAAENCLQLGGNLFCHGDAILTGNGRGHLLFRWFSKCRLAHCLLEYLPCAHHLVARIQAVMQKRSLGYSRAFPAQAVEAWSKEQFAAGSKNVFLGHFHREYRRQRRNGQNLFCLPDWKKRQEIAVYDPADGTYRVLPWRSYAASKRGRTMGTDTDCASKTGN
ncbi:MAG: hypothetical protein GX564_04425 [Oligosphaeraceae bacterium]|nr:hypothetical protein [Oligosphaeraceae bacterium]